MKITLENDITPASVPEINRVISIAKKHNSILAVKAELECCFFDYIRVGHGHNHSWVKIKGNDERVLIIE